jgi:hypothetical protein
MRRLGASGVLSGLLAAMLLSSACGSGTAGTEAESTAATPRAVTDKDFDPGNFDRSADVDNTWFPLVPGTQFTWEGHALDEGERISRAVVFTVTDMTKVIDGVRTVVTWDRDYTDGEQEEIEITLFAQDNDGNVWQLGEYPEEYDGKEIVKTPTWIAGLHGARAGIIMLANPQPGMPDYAEGWGPEVHWNDRAYPYRVGKKVCVPAGCYRDVVVIDEFNPDEPGAHQLKYYAPGVGGVGVGWRGENEEEKEELELVDLRHLTPSQLSAVDQKVLEQEKRGFRYSPDVYGQTEPIEQSTSA